MSDPNEESRVTPPELSPEDLERFVSALEPLNEATRIFKEAVAQWYMEMSKHIKPLLDIFEAAQKAQYDTLKDVVLGDEGKAEDERTEEV